MSGVHPAPADGQWYLTGTLAAVLPVLLALLLAWQWGWREPGPIAEGPVLQPVEADSAATLATLFAGHDYVWPPQQPVPLLALQSLPPDLAAQPTMQKKALFFQALLPLVLAENARLEQKRDWLERLRGQPALDEAERARLEELLERYRIGAVNNTDEALVSLLLHVDRVPVALVLAQAANESGWGSSRFVLQANNLFGEWTWRAEEGIEPLVRNSESRHYVRRFDSLADSVRSYIYNINVGHAYAELRQMRAAMRERGESVFDAIRLANGLQRYSIRGEEYVAEIQQMIDGNRLQRLQGLSLAD